MDHRDAYPGFAALFPLLEVLGETTKLAKPSERTFHYPAARQDDEALLTVEFGHDLEDPTGKAPDPVAQAAFVIAAIGPEERKAREAAQQLHHDEFGTMIVLNPGAMHHHDQKQPHRVYGEVALAALDLLAGIVAVAPPFCRVRTDWESIIAADGVGSRPACRRTFSRRAS